MPLKNAFILVLLYFPCHQDDERIEAFPDFLWQIFIAWHHQLEKLLVLA